MGTKFEITTQDGQRHVGHVQGCGGLIAGRNALERLRGQAELAAEGDALAIYEPAPGCVLLYPRMTARNPGPRVAVSLVGARIEVAA